MSSKVSITDETSICNQMPFSGEQDRPRNNLGYPGIKVRRVDPGLKIGERGFDPFSGAPPLFRRVCSSRAISSRPECSNLGSRKFDFSDRID